MITTVFLKVLPIIAVLGLVITLSISGLGVDKLTRVDEWGNLIEYSKINDTGRMLILTGVQTLLTTLGFGLVGMTGMYDYYNELYMDRVRILMGGTDDNNKVLQL